MDQAKINEAVTSCTREALRHEDDPLMALESAVEHLRAAGWHDAEIQTVKKTALRMLSVIYDASGDEAKSQAEQA